MVMTISNVGALPIVVLAADAVERVAGDANLWKVAEALVEADVGALAVANGDEVSPIVSERDIVRALAAGRDPSTTTALDVANSRLVWCDVDSTVAEVAEEMMEHYVRHVLVEDDGRVVGIVRAYSARSLGRVRQRALMTGSGRQRVTRRHLVVADGGPTFSLSGSSSRSSWRLVGHQR